MGLVTGVTGVMPEARSGYHLEAVQYSLVAKDAQLITIVIPEEELLSNTEFEADASGWTMTGTSVATTISQLVDTTTTYGTGVLKIEDTDGYSNFSVYSTTAQTSTEDADSRYFLGGCWMKSDQYMTVGLYLQRNTVARQIAYRECQVDDTWRFYSVFGQAPELLLVGADAGDVMFRIHPTMPTTAAAQTGTLLIDHAVFRRVYYQSTIPDSASVDHSFEQIKRAENTLMSGGIRTYRQGWRYKVNLDYEYMTAELEDLRNLVAEESEVFVYPYGTDQQFFARCRWMEEYTVKYPQSVRIGHAGGWSLTGTEILGRKP